MQITDIKKLMINEQNAWEEYATTVVINLTQGNLMGQ